MAREVAEDACSKAVLTVLRLRPTTLVHRPRRVISPRVLLTIWLNNLQLPVPSSNFPPLAHSSQRDKSKLFHEIAHANRGGGSKKKYETHEKNNASEWQQYVKH